MKGKLLLGGGGEAEDEYLLLKKLAGWVGTVGKLLFWPVAFQDIRMHETGLQWLKETFKPLNVRDITMWSHLADHNRAELDAYTAVFIGGGNTYWLLHQLIQSGFDEYLTGYVEAGGIVYGGSAGAVILGRDIDTVSHLDPNEINLTDTKGLDLAAGHSVWVHYKQQDDPQIRRYLQKQKHAVIAISERSGVLIEAGGMESLGYEPAYIFDPTGKSRV
jgi:dipeptidase E